MKDVSNKFNIATSTLSNFIDKAIENKSRTFENLNQAVLKWFTSMYGNNIPIHGTIILEKARKFGEAFDCKDFQASNRWLR